MFTYKKHKSLINTITDSVLENKNQPADIISEEVQLDEVDKKPALKKAIGSAWKQRAKRNRLDNEAGGYMYTGGGRSKSPEWADKADDEYKKKRARVSKLKSEEVDEKFDSLFINLVNENLISSTSDIDLLYNVFVEGCSFALYEDDEETQ
jgi:hypothetical protein